MCLIGWVPTFLVLSPAFRVRGRSSPTIAKFQNGGEGGIRTLGTPFEVHTLSRRARSATLAPLHR